MSAYYDYMRIPGLPGANALFECIQGIGAYDGSTDDIDVISWINTTMSDWGAWLSDAFAKIETVNDQYAAEGFIPSYESGVFVMGNLPVPRDPGRVDRVYLIMYVIKFVLEVVYPIVKGIIDEYLKRPIRGGEDIPLIKVFKKFAFLKEGDKEQGFPDLTSLLLMLADKPIEIYDAHGHRDVFLDNVIINNED